MARPAATHRAACSCGQVQIEGTAPPILTAVCYCEDCQEAGRRLEGLPGAAPVLEADGGTEYVLLRKDRVDCTAGRDHLKEHRLKPDSRTRRVVATCCNTPMFVDVTIGHWLSLYRRRLPDEMRPPIDMRVVTRSRHSDLPFPDDAPRVSGQSGRFMWKIATAWVRMGFRIPRIEYVQGKIE